MLLLACTLCTYYCASLKSLSDKITDKTLYQEHMILCALDCIYPRRKLGSTSGRSAFLTAVSPQGMYQVGTGVLWFVGAGEREVD